MVGGERPGGRAAGDVMHHRRFHFQEAARVEPAAQRGDDARTRHEHLARLRRHDQVDVALAVALLDVGEAMELVRQRPQRLHQQAQLVDLDRQLAGLGAHRRAFGGDDVADVPALERVVGRAQRRRLQEQLDTAAHVLHGGERGLAHDALGQQAPGDGNATAAGFQRLAGPGVGVGVFGLQVAGEVRAAEIVGEGDALPAQRGELAAALGDQLVLVEGQVVVRFAHVGSWIPGLRHRARTPVDVNARTSRDRFFRVRRTAPATTPDCRRHGPHGRNRRPGRGHGR